MPNKLLNNISLPLLLRKIGQLADKHSVRAYLIGGSVRDMLLGIKNLDWDITVEGNPKQIVRALAKELKGSIKAYPMFGTFVVTLHGGRHIDFATARTEIYKRPGALPEVMFSSLNRDVFRRDFTINALALALNGPFAGKPIDLCTGLKDLKSGVLRVMYEKSFKDDPTRIFRLARFAGRGYKIEPKTGNLAVKYSSYISKVTPVRLKEELKAILDENNPLPALSLLEKWGILDKYFPELRLNKGMAKIKSLEKRLALLLSHAAVPQRKSFLDRFGFEREIKNKVMAFFAAKISKSLVTGKDLVKLGYMPGPRFKNILETLSLHNFKTKKEALNYLFDKFPKN